MTSVFNLAARAQHPSLLRMATYVQALLSVAVGGAAGAVVNFFAYDHGVIAKIDWHQLAISAGVAAGIAVSHYFLGVTATPAGPVATPPPVMMATL